MKLIVTVFFTILMLQNSVDLDTVLMQYLDSFNAVERNPIRYTALGRTELEGEAIIYLVPHSKVTDEDYPGIVDWAVASHKTGAWAVTFPGDPGYSAAYESLAPALLREATSAPYTIHADPALAGALDDYQLPYADGAWATITRSYRQHGTGRIDFDLGGARDVAAAKDGIIIYASDGHSANAYASGAWWYWNTVIIRHAEHEFSLYGHLEATSIPQWIKDACAASTSSALTCAVPIHAGDLIAREGSTGYSSNPHLHAEFGQGFGIAAYPDTLDEDRDGIRAEPVYAGYLYAEQNVGFSGATANEVARWAYGTLQQASHIAPSPADTNLILNGDFSAEKDDWTPSGQLNWSVQDGVLRILRLRTTAVPDWAAFYQNVDAGIPAHTPFEATIQLGNASSITKTVTISVFNRSGRQHGSIECAFSLPANAQLSLYTLRGVTVNTWASLRFEVSVNPPDGTPAALVDNATLYYRPSITENECITPTS